MILCGQCGHPSDSLVSCPIGVLGLSHGTWSADFWSEKGKSPRGCSRQIQLICREPRAEHLQKQYKHLRAKCADMSWVWCDVCTWSYLNALGGKRGFVDFFFFQLVGIWYLSLLSTGWKSHCEAYLLRHAFRKNYFCLGFFGGISYD